MNLKDNCNKALNIDSKDNVYNINDPKLLKALKRLESKDLQVFNHHIYEFKKGLRNLVLVTQKKSYQKTIEERLKKHNIDYIIHDITPVKINVYFGHKACIDVVRTFSVHLSKLKPEEDFILGIMLGYDRLQQCHRYLKRHTDSLKIN